MKRKGSAIFTRAVEKHIDAMVGRLGMNYRLDPVRRTEVKVSIMEYLWANSKYYNPQLGEWNTFASLVVANGVKRESARLAHEAREGQKFVRIEAETEGGAGLQFPDATCDIGRLAFAMDFADVLAKMPVSAAAILHAVVVEGLSFAEAARRFGLAPKSFYRSVWPRVRKEFFAADGDFLFDDGQ